MDVSRHIMQELVSSNVATGKQVPLSDYQLWKDFKSGNLMAYSLIYRKHFFTLFKYGKKYSSDQELIKDCIQDLFIKIWNNRENLNDTTSIRYYLVVSLKRKLLDTLDSPSQRLRAEEDLIDAEQPDTYTDEEEASYQKEKVFKAINKLSKHQQQLLQMKFYRNQSNQEIAKELGITMQSVYNLVFKALRSIRRQLQIAWWVVFIQIF